MIEVKPQKHACVLVLGDIGRSPRMQYHSISLAENGFIVDLVCYNGTKPFQKLTNEPLVSFHYLAEFPSIKMNKYLNYVLKTIWQAINLLFVLFLLKKPEFILVQNPPAVPSLFVCWFYTLVTRTKYIIDWHNYAYSIMALNTNPQNVLVKLTKYMEQVFGQRAYFNFCVSNEMKKDLWENWKIEAKTLYDRPPEMFKELPLEEKKAVMDTILKKYNILDSEKENIMNNYELGIIVSSTSWTEDEDFSILISALQNYEDHYSEGNVKQLPNLLCIITGKGPLKEYYLEKIKSLKWKFVKVKTPWLEMEDYPKILACADLGICLHTSSSGLDLPMKVLDMFGCGLPVCAYEFKSLYELVEHEKNGFHFKNSKELSKLIQDWFENHPNNEIQKQKENKFKTELRKFQTLRWTENWNRVALPIVK